MKLINPIKDVSAYVYHYTACDIALNHILGNRTLMFNSFRNTNDPRESMYWDVSPFVRAELNLKLEQYDSISKEVSQILKANAKLICFSQDKLSAVNNWQPEAIISRGFAKPGMWHHYANKHNGVCLMFNREKLNRIFQEQLGNGNIFHGPVDYSNAGIIPKLHGDPFIIDLLLVSNDASYFSAIQNHFNRWHKQLFMQKLTDWSIEDEYRWVYLDSHSEPRYLSFGDSLEAIVLGAGVEENKHQEFLRHCVNHEADIAHLVWHNGYPKIEHVGQPYITHRNLANVQSNKPPS